MRKELFILTTLISISLTACSQQKFTKFEKELNEFRYSLYQDLDTIPFEQIRNMDFSHLAEIQGKTEIFIQQHEKDILQYKTNTLNRYTDIPLPDLKNYKPFFDESDISEINSVFEEYPSSLNRMFTLYSIDPLVLFRIYISIFNARMGNQEIAMEAIKDQVAAYSISTRKKDKNTWTVFIDKYRYIFQFTYNIEDNLPFLINVYERQ